MQQIFGATVMATVQHPRIVHQFLEDECQQERFVSHLKNMAFSRVQSSHPWWKKSDEQNCVPNCGEGGVQEQLPAQIGWVPLTLPEPEESLDEEYSAKVYMGLACRPGPMCANLFDIQATILLQILESL